MFAALTLLLITGCCKAQNTSCNNIKNKERTTERFDLRDTTRISKEQSTFLKIV